ncbi:conserved hypothetical protein [Gloeothece citriformis PCC 7424]|uniref:FG-GAP repeat protein n=1 Tax=Gloeothece citriformis (strain PCC 7424) TaxID=65393 RepID=B7K9H0_GLOC7|nr:hypothetical protein [Gloeothece citriformis]ACK68653.1 conserved hypothetical protein [Gloeothece citriformis PCC 7424]
MKFWHKVLLFSLINSLVFNPNYLAFANPEIEIEPETTLTNKIISSGAIRVSVSYQPPNFDNPESMDDRNFSYQIFYNNKKQVEAKDFTMMTGGVTLKDLDSNGTDEVIVRTFSGGAHCCTNFIIYTWQDNQFIKTETGFLDGGAGNFEDLNGDGKSEFLTFDNSFLYAFSSYAGSFPPTIIYTFNNGNFEPVTRNYPKVLRETLQQMYQSIRQGQKENYEVNGVLAGYVAQKILLGEYEDGWKFMLANYDKSSDWGLDIYDSNGNVIDQYTDFPTALKAFLIEQGYLDKNGNPSANKK